MRTCANVPRLDVLVHWRIGAPASESSAFCVAFRLQLKIDSRHRYQTAPIFVSSRGLALDVGSPFCFLPLGCHKRAPRDCGRRGALVAECTAAPATSFRPARTQPASSDETNAMTGHSPEWVALLLSESKSYLAEARAALEEAKQVQHALNSSQGAVSEHANKLRKELRERRSVADDARLLEPSAVVRSSARTLPRVRED